MTLDTDAKFCEPYICFTCKPIYDAYQNAAENYFIKYGEISHYYGRAEDALAKQKHRVMWERRHGPVGSGMKVEVKED